MYLEICYHPPLMRILDFLFPKRSLTGREGVWITDAERRELLLHPRHFDASELRRLGMSSLDAAFAVSTYGDCPFLRQAIHRFKYQRLPEVGEVLAAEFLASCRAHLAFPPGGCICPVPLHVLRRFSRGFNQAEILARALAAGTGLPLRSLLRRTRPTGHQARRKRGERLRAVQGAFRARPAPNPPPIVYLVDDLFTTGATLEACARALKAAGVQRVVGVVLAHD